MSNRNRKIAALKAKLNKEYGEGTVMSGLEVAEQTRDLARRTTGSLGIDWVLGGGWTVNHWHEIVGEYSTGKTAVVLKAVAANMAEDPSFEVLWIAAEDLDPDYAAGFGIDLDRFTLVPRNEMEIVFQTIVEFTSVGAVDMVVVDSIPALVPLEEDEKDIDESVVAVAARIIGKLFRKTRRSMRASFIDHDRPVTGIIINQYREKIGVTMGDNRTSPGGRAKEYACVTILTLRRGMKIHDDVRKHRINRRGSEKTVTRPVVVGQEIIAQATKNKTSPPFREMAVEFFIDKATVDGRIFEKGDYDEAKEIQSLAQSLGILSYSGAWRDTDGCEWRKRDLLEEALANDPEVRDHVRTQVQDAIDA